MATSLLRSHASFDIVVPSADVAAMQPAAEPAESAGAARPVTRMVVEIGGSAAWLAWQIEAGDVLIHEARSQLGGVAESLERYRGRMPERLQDQMMTALQAAWLAVNRHDLHGVAEAAREIRAIAEHYRDTTTTW